MFERVMCLKVRVSRCQKECHLQRRSARCKGGCHVLGCLGVGVMCFEEECQREFNMQGRSARCR